MNNKGKSILIVEDDEKIRKLVKVYLENEGYEVWEAQDGEDAQNKFMRYDPCFVILDLMLPKISGEQVCSWIREDLKADIPIIMLTAKVEEKDRIKGLEMGADDYVTKPFSPKELVTRVETVLRRTAQRCSKITYRGITLKPHRAEVHYRGQPISLTQHECKLLYFLMQHPNQVLSREQLIHELYPNQEKVVIDRTIDVHIGKLREKLKWDGKGELIETIRGMGYRFVSY
ncbi:response regulator transcription factor [Brevibacillus centrosporus]|jgi:DNA-binding response OmpR family regulator|uniref:response regulator n=1 Tax=Brevibacillus centrosporus TaxID=54910 RepID=UPI000F0A3EB4|nr:response regulator transcription factor [Brevibacillus centrosporus]MEC2133428.1 response regulator transcription factor [Brevibacillus centrosporus]RNB67745.1 DNA-binding response regulator [Brevibacillus centrosporus]GED34104.1 DNA-binding response regulator [Brevibacillus centrosporus]